MCASDTRVPAAFSGSSRPDEGDAQRLASSPKPPIVIRATRSSVCGSGQPLITMFGRNRFIGTGSAPLHDPRVQIIQ
ncbi:hypothetical protein C8D88_1367 [Lentzea atacamensis]|uniref:Uncharacterized protein n=1 Tax=Lentzea atacamensis TaxID=531938 RepID=A0A316H8L2_9PSEU|nr:hypothetical protein C8D88_1367 [Lentzea atacamensis]